MAGYANTGRTARDSFFGAGSSSNGSDAAGRGFSRGSFAPKETDATRDVEEGKILDMQRDTMSAQDKVLDAISASLGRQKELAHMIGDEAETSMMIIDEIGDRTERSTRSIERTNFRLKKLSDAAQSGSCWLWLAILALSVVFVVVLVLAAKF